MPIGAGSERIEATLYSLNVIQCRHLVGDPRDFHPDVSRGDRSTSIQHEFACDCGDVVVAKSPPGQGCQRDVAGSRHAGGVTGPHKSDNA